MCVGCGVVGVCGVWSCRCGCGIVGVCVGVCGIVGVCGGLVGVGVCVCKCERANNSIKIKTVNPDIRVYTQIKCLISSYYM